MSNEICFLEILGEFRYMNSEFRYMNSEFRYMNSEFRYMLGEFRYALSSSHSCQLAFQVNP